MTVFPFLLCSKQRVYQLHLKLLGLIREYGSVRVRSIAKLLQRSVRTVKHSIRGLIELRLIERVGRKCSPFTQYVLAGIRSREAKLEIKRLVDKLIDLGRGRVWVKLPIDEVNRFLGLLAREDPKRFGLVCTVRDGGSNPPRREKGGTKRDGCAEPSLTPRDFPPMVTAWDLWKQRQYHLDREKYWAEHEPEVWIWGQRKSLRDLTPSVRGDICKIGSFSFDDLSLRYRINRYRRRFERGSGWL